MDELEAPGVHMWQVEAAGLKLNKRLRCALAVQRGVVNVPQLDGAAGAHCKRGQGAKVLVEEALQDMVSSAWAGHLLGQMGGDVPCQWKHVLRIARVVQCCHLWSAACQ